MSLPSRFALSLVIITALGCGRPDVPAPLIVGHGGPGEGGAMELNSVTGVKEAWALGADGVELDVQLSSDGQLMCFHPQELPPRSSLSGIVNAHTAKALEKAGLTALDSILSVPHSGKGLIVLDCKLFAAGEWSSYLDRFVEALDRTVQAHQLQGRLNIECRSTEFLDRVLDRIPDARVCLYADRLGEAIPTALQHGYGGITVPIGGADDISVPRAHSQGLHVAVFGVQDRFAHHRAWSLKVDQVQSDDLAFALEWR